MRSKIDLPLPPDSERGLPNLMASLAGALGCPEWPLPSLEGLAPTLAGADTIILLVVDGMGEAQLRRHLAGGLLEQHCITVVDSVFPPTTAAAVGTFLTGLPPAGHALTGWYQWCEEIGETLAILPLTRRGQRGPSPEAAEWAKRLLDLPPFAGRLRVPATHVLPAWIAGTPFNRTLAGPVKQEAYGQRSELFPAITRALQTGSGPRFIYAYWPDYDTVAHDCGPDGEAAVLLLRALEAALAEFLATARCKNALLLITADHGFMTASPEHQIDLGEHPDLVDCLLRPLSGERRAAYAHVRPERREEFAARIQDRFGHALWLVPSTDLIANGWFGGAPFHPRLTSRTGDFTLLLKDDWSLIDTRPGDRHPLLPGQHGGISPAELRVPICAFPLKPA